jgi:hypothetical protein
MTTYPISTVAHLPCLDSFTETAEESVLLSVISPSSLLRFGSTTEKLLEYSPISTAEVSFLRMNRKLAIDLFPHGF